MARLTIFPLVALGAFALAACHPKTEAPAGEAPTVTAVGADPNAPAKGTQAAEAIGADSPGGASASAH